MAPSIVGESLKAAELLSTVFGKHLNFPCNPLPSIASTSSFRTDIIQAIQLGSPERVIAFCEAVQRNSPIGSFIRPIPGATTGYHNEVIFADGTFIDGSTLELSADGPLREPYVVYSQGCTHWTHWAIVLDDFLNTLKESSSGRSFQLLN
jgi:cystathionine beta-lyase family protein involved in aluminum resistance